MWGESGGESGTQWGCESGILSGCELVLSGCELETQWGCELAALWVWPSEGRSAFLWVCVLATCRSSLHASLLIVELVRLQRIEESCFDKRAMIPGLANANYCKLPIKSPPLMSLKFRFLQNLINFGSALFQ